MPKRPANGKGKSKEYILKFDDTIEVERIALQVKNRLANQGKFKSMVITMLYAIDVVEKQVGHHIDPEYFAQRFINGMINTNTEPVPEPTITFVEDAESGDFRDNFVAGFLLDDEEDEDW